MSMMPSSTARPPLSSVQQRTMQMTSDALIYGPVYNDKGVMTGFEDRVDSTTTSDGSLRYAVGTDSVTNDVIKLGGIPYAYTRDVKVYFVNVDGDLEPVASLPLPRTAMTRSSTRSTMTTV